MPQSFYQGGGSKMRTTFTVQKILVRKKKFLHSRKMVHRVWTFDYRTNPYPYLSDIHGMLNDLIVIRQFLPCRERHEDFGQVALRRTEGK